MFFQNLLSKFTLIFTIFSFSTCFSSEIELIDRSENISKRQKTVRKNVTQENKENEESEKLKTLVQLVTPLKKAYTLQSAYITQNPSTLSPVSHGHYKVLVATFNGQKIINPHIRQIIAKKRMIFSPFIRRYISRIQVRKLIKTRKVASLPVIAFSKYVELPPETPDEKAQRKQRENDYFLSLNKVDFSAYKNLKEREAAYWIPFWQYIAAEKAKVLNNERSKIRPEELEDIAKAVSLQDYKSFEVEGTLFYYHLDFLDFSLKDSSGRTNTQRLKDGLNPVGIDGRSMEIHHLTMFNDSILVLLSRKCHGGASLKKITNDPTATFHPQPEYYGRKKNSDIDRTAFARIAASICIKLGEIVPPISIGTPSIFPSPSDDELKFDLDCVFGDDESEMVFLEEDKTSASPILENNDEAGSIFYTPSAGANSFASIPQPTFLPKPVLLVDNNTQGIF